MSAIPIARRIDGYLSARAQHLDPTARVIVHNPGSSGERWELERSGHEPLGIGESYGRAQQGLVAWIRSERARAALTDEEQTGGTR